MMEIGAEMMDFEEEERRREGGLRKKLGEVGERFF